VPKKVSTLMLEGVIIEAPKKENWFGERRGDEHD
jgi:hypothetical protein